MQLPSVSTQLGDCSFDDWTLNSQQNATRVLHQVEGKVTGDFAMHQLCLELGANPNWPTIFSEAPTKKQPMKSVMTVALITTTLIRSRRTGTTTGVAVLFSMRPGMVDD